MHHATHRRQGFTLIEVLVTLAIITVLVGLLMPVLASARAAARAKVCLSNLRQVGAATLTYAQDWDDFLPQTPVFPVTTTKNSYGALTALNIATFGNYPGASLAAEFLRHHNPIPGANASTLARLMVEAGVNLGDGVFTCPSDSGEADRFGFSSANGTVAAQSGTSYLWDPNNAYPSLGQDPVDGQDLGSIADTSATRLWQDYGIGWHLTLHQGQGFLAGQYVTDARVNCAFADGHAAPGAVQEVTGASRQASSVAPVH